MALAWVIEIYHVELGRYLIAVSVLNQVVIGNNRQVIKFKVVYIKSIGLLLTTAYDFPLPGVPKIMLARKGFTTFIQPFHSFLPYQNLVGRLMEYSFSIRRVSCMNDSFSVLKTSSSKLFFNRRLIHKPDANRQKKPPTNVAV